MESVTLSRLHNFIARVIKFNFDEPLWVSAEILQITHKSGHTYLELAEKSTDGQILAQASAVLWKTKKLELNSGSNISIENLLAVGYELKFMAYVNFHPRYGYKLIIEKIDKVFGLGQIALSRKKTIDQLKTNNLWQLNRLLEISPVIQDIALITSPSTAAYADFMESLSNNLMNFRFRVHEYPVSVQGENSVSSIVAAFKEIKLKKNKPDLVVLIRGGGSKQDLADFDSYDIAFSISTASVPVITGIGHQIDESIADLSAFLPLKTPTAAAEFIIAHNNKFETGMELEYSEMVNLVKESVFLHRLKLESEVSKSVSVVQKSLHCNSTELSSVSYVLDKLIRKIREHSHLSLSYLENELNSNDPEYIFAKGYSYTTANGKSLADFNILEAGQELITRVSAGIVHSKVSEPWQKSN